MTKPRIPRATLPSEKAALREDAAAKAKSKAADERRQLLEAFGVTFATAEGKIVLNWIRKQCLHGETTLAREGNSFKIDPQITVYRGMQQALYLELRKLVPKRTLKEIEYD